MSNELSPTIVEDQNHSQRVLRKVAFHEMEIEMQEPEKREARIEWLTEEVQNRRSANERT